MISSTWLTILLAGSALLTSCKTRQDFNSDLSEQATSQALNQKSFQIVLQDLLPFQGGLNPYTTHNDAVQSIANFIYEPLAVYLTEDPFLEEPKPLLAQKIEYDDMARSLTITLHQGIYFQQLNGVKGAERTHQPYELTVDDVEFSLLMASHLNTSSSSTWLRGSDLRVEKLDKYTLRVYWNPNHETMTSKNSNYILAYKILSTRILPKKGIDYPYYFDWSSPSTPHFREAISKSMLNNIMWGTGPYKFASTRGQHYVYNSSGNGGPSSAISYYLTKNENYWGNKNTTATHNLAASLPFTDIEMVGNMTFRQDDLLNSSNKRLSMAYMDAHMGKRFIKGDSYGVRSVPIPTRHTYFLVLSHRNTAFEEDPNFHRSPKVKQALNLGIDRSKLATGLEGISYLAQSFFGSPNYGEKSPFPYNLNSSQQILRSAGILDANGKSKIPLLYRGRSFEEFIINYATHDQTAETIAFNLRQQLSQIGFRTAIPEHPTSHISRFEHPWRREVIIRKIKHEYLPDPKVYWHSRGAGNDALYSNPQVDAIIDRIHQELDPSRFHHHYQELDHLLKQDLPAIPLLRVEEFVAQSSSMSQLTYQNPDLLNVLIKVLDW